MVSAARTRSRTSSLSALFSEKYFMPQTYALMLRDSVTRAVSFSVVVRPSAPRLPQGTRPVRPQARPWSAHPPEKGGGPGQRRAASPSVFWYSFSLRGRARSQRAAVAVARRTGPWPTLTVLLADAAAFHFCVRFGGSALRGRPRLIRRGLRGSAFSIFAI